MMRLCHFLLLMTMTKAWVVPTVPSCRSRLFSSSKEDKPLSYEEASELADQAMGSPASKQEEEIIAATLEGLDPYEEPSASFDDASQNILKEENEEMMANMEADEDDAEFENMSDQYDAIREAIRARTADLGIEKSVLQAQLIEDAEKRAAAGEKVTGLDLSKISTLNPMALKEDEEEDDMMPKMPMMEDDLEEEYQKLSDEAKKIVDPTEGMKWYESLIYEAQQITWPTPMEVFKEVLLLLACVGVMAVVIINLDNFLKEKVMEYGMIPRPEDITQSFDGLELPEGWTEGLNEQDIADVP